jgi:hypothetical protein
VVGIDGLKIEPLDPALSGITAQGERVPFEPIRDIATLAEPLDDRVMAGFGGVAEYGITVRWDKNFLKVIRLLIERREHFALYGGVRFGGTLDAEDAFALGFDHVALAAVPGRPTVLDLPNGLATGVRTASDFLMALQLTGAAKTDSVANMQLRMPVVVVGGGLTAIDTATEALAYYPVQVEKFLERYDALVAERGRESVEASWTRDEQIIGAEFLAHARAIRAERAAAASEGRAPRILELLQGWGGVTIAYRRRLIDSPSYTLNHEEVEKALEEGIRFGEGLTPLAVEIDAQGHARGLKVSAQHNDGDGVWHEYARVSDARAHYSGRRRNASQHRDRARGRGAFSSRWQVLPAAGRRGSAGRSRSRTGETRAPRGADRDSRGWPRNQFFRRPASLLFRQRGQGDGEREAGYPIVSRMLHKVAPASNNNDSAFFALLDRELRATIERVVRLTPTIVEVVVRAPAAARRFSPGAILSSAEFRVARAENRRDTIHDGRSGADRCVGGSRGRPRLDDRARNGRVVGSLRNVAARRTGGVDGADRYPDRNRIR